MDCTDASACLAATQRICRDAAAAEMARVTSQILMITAEQYPFLKWSTVYRSAATCLPGTWWNTNGPYDLASDLISVAEQVFSLAPTSASGERSFKQRSRVHTKTRNRLGAENADKSSAIIFNKRQNMSFYDGALSQGRTSTVEKLMQILLVVLESDLT
jgi:hAT family C-terminal dimerisation region